ncbi:MAG TPA: DUF3034 family protein [Planctomycetota bacterium]|nr:DUF3034 family protein [Planctomycetota bacterium]
MRKARSLLLAAVLAAASVTLAGEGPAAEAKKAAPPPIPLHTIEGTSGVFITPTAYFANLPEDGGIWGKPSFAFSAVKLGEKNLLATTVTTNLFKRVEFGYSFMRLHLGDWAHDVRAATTLRPQNHVEMHTLSARYMLVREGEWGKAWVPAITAGLSWKHNDSIMDINRDLAGTCKLIGVRDDDGFDFTLTASKMITGVLPNPLILSAGLRSTEAAQIGLLGFTHDRDIVFEGSAVYFLTSRVLLAAEYRQKPDNLKRIPGLVGNEDDWWTLAAAYIVNDHCTAALGYGHFGTILNHDENASWALQLKWEF